MKTSKITLQRLLFLASGNQMQGGNNFATILEPLTGIEVVCTVIEAEIMIQKKGQFYTQALQKQFGNTLTKETAVEYQYELENEIEIELPDVDISEEYLKKIENRITPEFWKCLNLIRKKE